MPIARICKLGSFLRGFSWKVWGFLESCPARSGARVRSDARALPSAPSCEGYDQRLQPSQPPESDARRGRSGDTSSTQQARVPERPTIDGLEERWSAPWDRDAAYRL